MATQEMIDRTLGRILGSEGGEVDDPDDRGGATNRGVTIPAMTEYLGRDATAEDIRGVTEEIARDLYRKLYIEKPGFLLVEDPALFWLLVDSAVLCGRGLTVRWLQQALHVPVDGSLGPVTGNVLKHCWAPNVYRAVLALRAEHHGRDVTDHPKQARFAAGWNARLATLIRACP